VFGNFEGIEEFFDRAGVLSAKPPVGTSDGDLRSSCHLWSPDQRWTCTEPALRFIRTGVGNALSYQLLASGFTPTGVGNTNLSLIKHFHE